MSKDKQYRAFLKSKHNNEIMWTGKYYNTFKGAKTDVEKQRFKEKFGNEYYTEIKVLLIEERIVKAEVPKLTKKKCPLTKEECYSEGCEWWTTLYNCLKREALLVKVRSEPF